MDMPSAGRGIIRNRLKRYGFLDRVSYPNILEFNEYISKNFADVTVLYMPTYRRLNDDLRQFGAMNSNWRDNSDKFNNERKLEDELSTASGVEVLDFGMERITKKIDDLLDLIKKQAITGFNDLNSKLLQQYLTLDDVDGHLESQVDGVKLKKMLERLVHEKKSRQLIRMLFWIRSDKSQKKT